MSAEATDRLRARVRVVKTRAAVRAWEYRQRHLAAGVWFRLRRVLADAREAYIISDADAHALVAAGCEAEPSGLELAPAKTIFVVDASRIASLTGSRQIPVGLNPEFLQARAVALVAFDDAQRSRRRARGGRPT